MKLRLGFRLDKFRYWRLRLKIFTVDLFRSFRVIQLHRCCSQPQPTKVGSVHHNTRLAAIIVEHLLPLLGSLPIKQVFLYLHKMFYRPEYLCSTRMLYLSFIMAGVTHTLLSSCNLDFELGHIAILILWLIMITLWLVWGTGSCGSRSPRRRPVLKDIISFFKSLLNHYFIHFGTCDHVHS